MSTKPELRVVWLKRDLRLQDNEAIYNALQSGTPVVILYCFEPLLLNDVHYSERHWNFIKQSIADLNTQLAAYNSKILAVKADIIPTINQLLNSYQIKHIYSHQETGVLVTYNRDKTFKRFCKNNLIVWHENTNNGVQRGLKDRENWIDLVEAFYAVEPLPFRPKSHERRVI
jgi:deoxyribodipyrimidine photo-lyase